jgi:CBS domain-containing protein
MEAHMDTGQICNRNVVTATRDTTIVEAAHLMRHHHIGDLIVVDETNVGRRPVGIVTDRDIVVEVVAPGLDPRAIKLGDLVIGPMLTVDEHDRCADTVRRMAAGGVRRMPVVNAEGLLVGIVTLDDLLPPLTAELAQLSQLGARAQERELATRK